MRVDREAADRLAAELAKPDDDGMTDSGKYFDPWSLFPDLYGSYSSDFDECAIQVLEGLGEYDDPGRRDLGAEMFREMLCNRHFCDYGSSPRVCFPTGRVREMLPQWIERWKTYYERQWGQPYSPPTP